jgi:hypothetical protein
MESFDGEAMVGVHGDDDGPCEGIAESPAAVECGKGISHTTQLSIHPDDEVAEKLVRISALEEDEAMEGSSLPPTEEDGNAPGFLLAEAEAADSAQDRCESFGIVTMASS